MRKDKFKLITQNRVSPACKAKLRICKLDVVVYAKALGYSESTILKENFIMKLQEKIIMLRKNNGWSQEEFAEKMYVSRQAISRWENGTALPDAQNVLQLSKLFHVTTDYLLNDDYESDGDIPVVQRAKQEKDDLISRKKMLHLISAIAFAIAAFCSVAGVITSISGTQFGLSCFSLALCAGNAAAQFVLFFKK